MKLAYRLLLLCLLGSLTTVLVGCGDSGPPSITSAVTSHDYKDGAVVDETTAFKSTDKLITCVVHVGGNTDGAAVKFVWTSVDTTAAQNYKIAESTLNMTKDQNVATGTYTQDKDYPVGKYKVDIYLNDQLAKTVEFTVS